MTNSRTDELLYKFLKDQISPEELYELQEIIHDSSKESSLEEALQKAYSDSYMQVTADHDMEMVYQSIRKRLLLTETPVKKLVGHSSKGKWWMVAASFIVCLSLGWYLWNSYQPVPKPIAVQSAKDVAAPVINKATLQLADGTTVFLDGSDTGQLAMQGNVKIVKLPNGQIAYQTADGQLINTDQFNTLSNPRGSNVVDLTLSDGSRVWLNAGSTITFPVSFMGDKRKVILEGEGYFEIAKVAGSRFQVQSGSAVTEVLGTHFNVNAYRQHNDIKITLLEGKVQVLAPGGQKTTIQPGQQAVLSESDKLYTRSSVDMEQVLSWKSGYFNFDELSFEEAMHQLENWYDIKVVYKGEHPTLRFEGSLNRMTSLNGVLNVFKLYGLHFELTGRTLTIR